MIFFRFFLSAVQKPPQFWMDPIFVFPVVGLRSIFAFEAFDSHPFLSGVHFVGSRLDNIILFVFLFAFSEFLCELLEPCYVPLNQRCFSVVQNLLRLR